MIRGIVAGIFVGGRSSRMGGRPKGLIEARPGITLVGRWRALFDVAGLPCVLVGANEAYAREGVPAIPDASAEEELGPLGGLLALFDYAEQRLAIAVACDMPFVSEALLRRLVDAPAAPAVAPRREGRWEPFFARYDARMMLPIARTHAIARRLSLQSLLDAAPARELTLGPIEAAELRDWDTPEDVTGMGPGE